MFLVLSPQSLGCDTDGFSTGHKDNVVSVIGWQDHCCGVNGPSDWQKYTSAFRVENNDADYPWPRQCCVLNTLKQPLNLDACKLGVLGYYHRQVSPLPSEDLAGSASAPHEENSSQPWVMSTWKSTCFPYTSHDLFSSP